MNLLVVLSLLASGSAYADSGTGLQISVAGDTLGEVGLHGSSSAPGRLDVREAEVMFYAPTDYLFDGNVSFAAHREAGQYVLELHELYLSTSKLIPRSQIRLGKFFLGIGRLNQFHRHDWPFVSAPRVHETFFDEEGVDDTGIEYGYLLPIPFYLNLTAGVTSGWTYGHTHNEGNRPILPTHYLRAETYVSLGTSSGLQIGLNALRRMDSSATNLFLTGADFTAKFREGKVLRYLIQSEIWLRMLGGDTGLGLYVYPQMALGEQWYLGCRFDFDSTLSSSVGNSVLSLVPTLTFQPSEFTRFRLHYHFQNTTNGAVVDLTGSLAFQFTFLLGAHPAHDF